MSATIDWSDPAATSFLAEILGTPNPTASALAPDISAALESMMAQNVATAEVSMEDSFLAALPDFTYAMPVQLVIQGVTLTLLGVLLVHLLFTIRYHAPLSKVNYALQTSATILSVANIAAQLHVVMDALRHTGRVYPFVFDYIEVAMPKAGWTGAKKGAWLLLQGLNSLIVHLTHIQFLTMLFPSSLEVKLILGLLGPLALATTGLFFTELSTHGAVNDLGDAIRNTANSSLTLLYTFALFIWGLTINRSRAWRLDGGTAAFGALALILGVLGTAVNFVEIKEDRMRWLPGVVTCILLWQSWVGFWWWVGAGMWAGEAEDVEKKREKQRKKEEQRRRKREGKRKALDQDAAGDGGEASATQSVVGSLRRRLTGGVLSSSRPSAPVSNAAGESIELRDLTSSSTTSPPLAPPVTSPGGLVPPTAPPRAPHSDSNSSTISSSHPSSDHFYSPFLSVFQPFFTTLRTAHDSAAVAQAAKPPGLPDDVRRGWGIKAMMMRGKKERGERRQAARGRVEEGAEMGASERRAGFALDGGERLDEEGRGAEGEGDEAWEDVGAPASLGGSSGTIEAPRPARRRSSQREAEDARVAVEGEAGAMAAYPPRARDVETGEEPETSWRARGADGQQSWWWKGVVARWRLKDVSQWQQ